MYSIQPYVITDLLSVSLLVVSIATIYLAERVGHQRSRYLAIRSIEAVIGYPIIHKPSHGKLVLTLTVGGIVYLIMLPLWQSIFEAMNTVSPYLNVVPLGLVVAFYIWLGWYNLPAVIHCLNKFFKQNQKRLQKALFWSEWEIFFVVSGTVILFPIFQKFFDILALEYPSFPGAQFSEFGTLRTYGPSYIYTLYFMFFLIIVYLSFRIGRYGYFLIQVRNSTPLNRCAYKIWLSRSDIESIRYSLVMGTIRITVDCGGARFAGLVCDIGDELVLDQTMTGTGSKVAIKWNSITSISA